MKYYARVEKGIVVEVIQADLDINMLFHPDFVALLIECDDTVEQHDIYSNGVFSKPINEEVINFDMLQVSVQAHIDSVAKERGYDSLERCISYINSSNINFEHDAVVANAWRDAVWNHCFNYQSQVESGILPIPTSQELIDSLPAINWT